jgi:predicted DNA-binding transcriptional regulator YafY
MQKAANLLQLARLLQGSRVGLGLAEISEYFGVERRTAERMRDAVLQIYPDYLQTWDTEGRKLWRIPSSGGAGSDPLQSYEVTALETAAAMLSQHGADAQAQALRGVAVKIRAAIPDKTLRRLEPDCELLALSEALVQMPGPRAVIANGVVDSLRMAILGSQQVSFTYRSRFKGETTRRIVEPYGFIYGPRSYLLARSATETSPGFRLFSLSDLSGLEILNESFTRDDNFSLQDYVSQAFGAYHEDLYDVVWRVKPEAAMDARTWLFHSSQTLEETADGSLIVHFRAGGLREMCWHVFTWGGTIEILEPVELKDEMARQLTTFLTDAIVVSRGPENVEVTQ